MFHHRSQIFLIGFLKKRALMTSNLKPIDRWSSMIPDDLQNENSQGNVNFSNYYDQFKLILDVRSPCEYIIDHIPQAVNIPILENDERAKVGFTYSKLNPLAARLLGSSIIMKNLSRYLEKGGILYESLMSRIEQPNDRILVYCWRGGQRSKSVAIVLSEIGINQQPVSVLDGGYKFYRKLVIENLKSIPNHIAFIGICGLTGTGKTKILNYLKSHGEIVLDLENLAQHKGSLFGSHINDIELIKEKLLVKQLSQKLFESKLNEELINIIRKSPGNSRRTSDNKLIVWVECESRKIGNVHLPLEIWNLLEQCKRIIINVPKEERIRHIISDYSYWTRKEYQSATYQIINWLSKQSSKSLINHWCCLLENSQFEELVDSLLTEHYDPIYSKNRRKYFDCHNDNQVVKFNVESLKGNFIDKNVCSELISLSQRFVK